MEILETKEMALQSLPDPMPEPSIPIVSTSMLVEVCIVLHHVATHLVK